MQSLRMNGFIRLLTYTPSKRERGKFYLHPYRISIDVLVSYYLAED
jgi:hypothetical protein